MRDRIVRQFRAASAPEQEATAPEEQAAARPDAHQLQQIEDPWVARTLEHTLALEASTSDRWGAAAEGPRQCEHQQMVTEAYAGAWRSCAAPA